MLYTPNECLGGAKCPDDVDIIAKGSSADSLTATGVREGSLAVAPGIGPHGVAWIDQFGALGPAGVGVGENLADDQGNLYVVGGVGSGAALPGQISSGSGDVYVRKYDRDGNELWTRQYGSPGDDSALGMFVDAQGIYVAGAVWYNALPDQTPLGDADAYVRVYDLDGNHVWTRQFGTNTQDEAVDAVADDTGVYVVGYTLGTLPG